MGIHYEEYHSPIAQRLLQDVIDAVEATPAEFLRRGSPLDTSGNMCAIGCYAYAHDPEFRAYAASLQDTPESYEFPVDHNQIYELVELAYDLIKDQYVSTSWIYVANDSSLPYSAEDIESETPDQRKENILRYLRALLTPPTSVPSIL